MTTEKKRPVVPKIILEMEQRFSDILRERDKENAAKYEALILTMQQDRDDRRTILTMLQTFLGPDGEFQKLRIGVQELQGHMKIIQFICTFMKAVKGEKK